MDLKEYLMNINTALENEDGIYHIMIDEHSFKLHKDCEIEFHEDFMILYDKETNVNILVRYDCISAIQHISREKLDNMKGTFAEFLKAMKEEIDHDN